MLSETLAEALRLAETDIADPTAGVDARQFSAGTIAALIWLLRGGTTPVSQITTTRPDIRRVRGERELATQALYDSLTTDGSDYPWMVAVEQTLMWAVGDSPNSPV
jgi:hypothetical protein